MQRIQIELSKNKTEAVLECINYYSNHQCSAKVSDYLNNLFLKIKNQYKKQIGDNNVHESYSHEQYFSKNKKIRK